MARPPTYARAGRAIIKRPRGALYLASDINPILDQIDEGRAAGAEREQAHIQRKIDNERMTAEHDEMIATITSLEETIDTLTKELEKAEVDSEKVRHIRNIVV